MRFVVLGDLHYSVYSDPAHAAARERVFEAFFKQVVKLEADLVFAIGDTTNRGTLPELSGEDAVAERCGLKLLRVTGNHDTDSLEKSELARFFLGEHPSASKSELYTAFDFGSARFVVLDTSRVKCSRTDWSGFVGQEQLNWLSREIEQFNSQDELKYLIALGHHPLYDTTEHSTRELLNIANSDEVREVFGKLERTPGLYICGHNHSNSVFGPDFMGWYYVQAGAPLVCQSFRLITVEDTAIEVETLDFDLSDPELYAAFDLIRHNIEGGFDVHPLDAMYGKPTDRSLRIASI